MNVASNNLRQRPAATKGANKSCVNSDIATGTDDDATAVNTKSDGASDYKTGTNWVHDGGIESNPYFFLLIVVSPFLSLLLAHVTSHEMIAAQHAWRVTYPFGEMLPHCLSDVQGCIAGTLEAGASVLPTWEGSRFILGFLSLALLLEFIPGKIGFGPETATGHVPKYVDNGVAHCFLFTLIFILGSNLGPCGAADDEAVVPEAIREVFQSVAVCNAYHPYDFGIIYDVFPSSLAFLNLFGILFCFFLTIKGLYFPSTQDNGSSGSWIKDYLWGTELYPRVFGLDLKRFVNCRFSMTYWQLAGLSFCYRSYMLHDRTLDWGLFFSAVSQYLYLVKFFFWEMGYMRSIDIIVDRAGYEIQWGCLVWVPAVYTFHTRFLVQHPSGLSFGVALALFLLSLTGVALNYAADLEREVFRATGGQALVWGKKPKFITAEYTVVDRNTGKTQTKQSLLLASGFWGMARHFQYFFELMAAYSWCFLSNPLRNGVLPMFYAFFLTALLVDRAKRDTEKCHLKYGKFYEEYCRLVPYKIVPGVY